MPKGKDRHYRRRRSASRSSSNSRSPSPPAKPPPRESGHRNSRGGDRGGDRGGVRAGERGGVRGGDWGGDKGRRRSRSRERKRSKHHRSRSRERRERERERDRRRSRTRSRSPHKKRSKKRDKSSKSSSSRSRASPSSREQQDGKKSERAAKEPEKNDEASLEAAKAVQEKLEERRKRLEAWRLERQKEEEEEKANKEGSEGEGEGEGEGGGEGEEKKKGWTLEDDDEDDEENTVPVDDEAQAGAENGATAAAAAAAAAKGSEAMEVEEEDVDPLDAFMVGVQEEVKEINTAFQKKLGTQIETGASSNVVTVTKVKDNQKPHPNQLGAGTAGAGSSLPAEAGKKKKKKGELLHNDQDAMEYSEEEDNADSELVSALQIIAKKNKGKDLPKVDHNKIEYAPFRKDFYVEVPELAKMTKEEVAAYRVELESIKIKGKNCPHPVKTWAQCGLPSKVLDVMKRCGYERPTPIQAQGIPAIMSGRDLIGIAKTGSGKTLAFLLPMLRHVLDQPPLLNDDGPIAVILTPTRELAIQIYTECRRFCKPLKLWAVCVYGGTGISEQIADLKRGCEIVVCTPGRMIDMLAANSGRVTNLRRTTYLVLDEADRMFDMGFEPQVTKIIQNTRPDRQTVLFSATFPRQMEALARKILTKPVEVQVGGRSVVCKDVHQSVIVIEDHQKFYKLLELLGIYCSQGSVLVFVERQEAADALIRDLMKSSYSCMALHGGMDQFDRDSTISDFKNGSVKILVATSVAARGLDVKHLILVVNYDCPNHYEDYVHRCGRTGRAGNKGFAYTFVSPDQQKMVGDIIKALELSGGHVPEELEEMWKAYLERLKAEGKIKTLPSGKMMPIIKKKKAIGFTGKGFKFDEQEAAKTAESKLKQKSALGMADEQDEDNIALLTLDKKLDDIFGNKVNVIDPSAPIVPPALLKPGLLGASPAGGEPPSESLTNAAAIANKILKSKAMSVAGPAGLATGLAAQEAASAIMKGGNVQVTGAVLASQIAASINDKLGAGPAKAADTYLPLGTIVPGQETPGGESFLKYTDEIEINSFPQQIRFRVTTRDVLDDIGEFSEAYITVRGNYVPQGREPREGEKRLFLSLEGKSERAIQLAKQEIKRVIKEEAQKMASRIKPHQQAGRYSVL